MSDRYLIVTAEMNARALAIERLTVARLAHASAIREEAEALRQIRMERKGMGRPLVEAAQEREIA